MESLDSHAARRQVTHGNIWKLWICVSLTKSILAQHPVAWRALESPKATSATRHLPMPNISGAFKHQLINQLFFCTQMEHAPGKPTDFRHCFLAA